jgi:hypothetical protein
MQSYWLKQKVTPTSVMHFNNWKPSASGPTLTDWTPEIASCSDFWLQTPQKNSKLSDILAYFQPK